MSSKAKPDQSAAITTITHSHGQTVGHLVRAGRLKKGVSQAKMARDLEISQATLQKIETGNSTRSKFLGPAWRYLGLPDEQLTEFARQHVFLSHRKDDLLDVVGELSKSIPGGVLRDGELGPVSAEAVAALGQTHWTRLIQIVDIQLAATTEFRGPTKVVIHCVLADDNVLSLAIPLEHARRLLAELPEFLAVLDARQK